jgi:3D (Asp-Asp-Asp) domain-containing protein
MVRYKLYGILSMFIFSLPKVLPTTSASIKEKPSPATSKEINYLPIRKVSVATKPPKPINVTASVYFPVENQTDDSPLITADNSKINHRKPKNHRWIAVSRNLLRRWGGTIDFGDTLKVKGISKYMDGHYVVRDTMNKRLKNRIDILVGPKDNIMGFWKNVEVYNLN